MASVIADEPQPIEVWRRDLKLLFLLLYDTIIDDRAVHPKQSNRYDRAQRRYREAKQHRQLLEDSSISGDIPVYVNRPYDL